MDNTLRIEIRKKLKTSAEINLFETACRYFRDGETRKAFFYTACDVVKWDKKDALRIRKLAKKYVSYYYPK